MMVVEDQYKRASIDMIKSTKWYNGEIYTNEECAEILRRILNPEECENSYNYYENKEKSFEENLFERIKEANESNPFQNNNWGEWTPENEFNFGL